MAQPTPYELFAQELVKAAELTTENTEADALYVRQLAEEVEKRMGLTVMSELKDDTMVEYLEMIDRKATPEEIGAFFAKSIPHFTDKRDKVFEDFAKGFLRKTKAMRESHAKS